MKMKPWKAPEEHRHRLQPTSPPRHVWKEPHEVIYEGLEVLSAQMAELQSSIDELRGGKSVT